jgi:hypothetical protein
VALQSSDAAPSFARTYEIQRFSNGRWILDSVADDKKVAIEMATALWKGGRAPGGVQVMAVQSRASQFSEVRVFRSTPNDGAAEKQAPAPKVEGKVEVKAPTEIRDFKHGAHLDAPESPKKDRFRDLFLALKVATFLGIAAAAFEAFHLLSR